MPTMCKSICLDLLGRKIEPHKLWSLPLTRVFQLRQNILIPELLCENHVASDEAVLP